MRTADVRRTVLMTALWLLVVAAGTAWWAGRTRPHPPGEVRAPAAAEAGPPADGSSPSGRELYQRHCRRCHAPEDLVAPLRGPAAGQVLLELLEFLDGHGASDAREDRAIAAFLLASQR